MCDVEAFVRKGEDLSWVLQALIVCFHIRLSRIMYQKSTYFDIIYFPLCSSYVVYHFASSETAGEYRKRANDS